MSGQPHGTSASSLATRNNGRAIGHYILGKTIGEGTFGKVKLGTHVTTGENVAIKVLEKDRIVDVADVERVAREIHILKLVRHPHIVQLYEIVETSKQLYLIMEYASGGELFDYIVANTRVKELEAVKFFRQIIAGVSKVHEMSVVHRDLKPENLLLDEHQNIKIVDFGLSNSFKDSPLLQTACGSPCYAAPEMIAGKRYVPARCDMWSCGVILFAMVCGYLPFEDPNTATLYKKILSARYQCPKDISERVRHLISSILCTDPQRRYTAEHIRQHPWFNGVISNASVRELQFQCASSGKCEVPSCHRCTRWFHRGPNEYIETDVLDQCVKYGLSRDYTVRCLQMNKHNHCTTTYYLLLEKKTRMAEKLDSSEEIREKFFNFEKIADKQIDPPMPLETQHARQNTAREPVACPPPAYAGALTCGPTKPCSARGERLFNAPPRKPRVEIGIVTPRKPRLQVGLGAGRLMPDSARVRPHKEPLVEAIQPHSARGPTFSLRMGTTPRPLPTTLLHMPPASRNSVARPTRTWNVPRSVASSCPPTNLDPSHGIPSTVIPQKATRAPLTARGSGGIPLSLRTRMPLTARGIPTHPMPMSARGMGPFASARGPAPTNLFSRGAKVAHLPTERQRLAY